MRYNAWFFVHCMDKTYSWEELFSASSHKSAIKKARKEIREKVRGEFKGAYPRMKIRRIVLRDVCRKLGHTSRLEKIFP